jgi:hypothetical protein
MQEGEDEEDDDDDCVYDHYGHAVLRRLQAARAQGMVRADKLFEEGVVMIEEHTRLHDLLTVRYRTFQRTSGTALTILTLTIRILTVLTIPHLPTDIRYSL